MVGALLVFFWGPRGWVRFASGPSISVFLGNAENSWKYIAGGCQRDKNCRHGFCIFLAWCMVYPSVIRCWMGNPRSKMGVPPGQSIWICSMLEYLDMFHVGVPIPVIGRDLCRIDLFPAQEPNRLPWEKFSWALREQNSPKVCAWTVGTSLTAGVHRCFTVDELIVLLGPNAW